MTTDTNVCADEEPLTRQEIVDALIAHAAHAARQPHHRDCATWNNAHARIDQLLSDLARTPA
jgi:hypothetical protein